MFQLKPLDSVARLAMGGMRDAQSILDQLISFCGNSIEEQDVLNVYGLVGANDLQLIATAIAQANYQGVISIVDQLVESGRDLFRVLVDLQALFRSVLLDSIRNEGSSALLKHPLGTESIMRVLDVLQNGERKVKQGFQSVLISRSCFCKLWNKAVLAQLIRSSSKCLNSARAKKK